ncbi:MAG: hypothetical protein ACI9RO_000930 [Alteromonas macleodii]|jgi:hypothetical protein
MLILFMEAPQFRRISFKPLTRFSSVKRLNPKPPRLQLSACYPKLFGNSALRRASLIKPTNCCGLEIMRVFYALLSHVMLRSWTGEKYPKCL